MGTVYSRSDGVDGKYEMYKVQFPLVGSGNDGSRLFLGRLGSGNEQLGSATVQDDRQSSTKNGRRQGTRCGDCTEVAGSAMVAVSDGITDRHLESWPISLFGERGRIWDVRTVQRELATVGAQDIERDVRSLTEMARCKATNKAYKVAFDTFDTFLTAVNATVADISVDHIEKYIVMMKKFGYAHRVKTAVVAVSNELKRRRLVDVTKDDKIKEILRGLERFIAENKKRSEERLPLPTGAVMKFLKKNPGMPSRKYCRDRMLVLLGFRLMRRASELCNLKVNDVQFREGWLNVFVSKSKTDQLGKGKWFPVEPSAGNIDVISLMREYLAENSIDKSYHLFPNLNDITKPMSPSSVSTVVKEVAKFADLTGRYSSHSLRIGGATAAMQGGATLEQIKAVGDWKSDAVLLYLRAIGAAKAGMTALMGL